jgi:hypothetical protein
MPFDTIGSRGVRRCWPSSSSSFSSSFSERSDSEKEFEDEDENEDEDESLTTGLNHTGVIKSG